MGVMNAEHLVFLETAVRSTVQVNPVFRVSSATAAAVRTGPSVPVAGEADFVN